MVKKLVFIGTSSGKTSLKRYHSSILISFNNFNVLVDCGDAVSRALLSSKNDPNNIDALVISHFHPDHISGLGSLITQMKLTKREKPLSIYTHQDFVSTIKFFLYNQYLFINKLKFAIRFHSYTFDENTELVKNLSFLPRRNSHLDKNRDDAGMGKISFDSSSFLFTVNKKNIFYTGDIGKEDDLYLFGDQSIEVMISEATHEEPASIIKAFTELNAKKLYITHIADEDEEKILNAIKEQKDQNIYAASDGLTVQL